MVNVVLLRDPGALNVETSWRRLLHALGHGSSEQLLFIRNLFHMGVALGVHWPVINRALSVLFLLMVVVRLIVKVRGLRHEGAWPGDQLICELLVSSAH